MPTAQFYWPRLYDVGMKRVESSSDTNVPAGRYSRVAVVALVGYGETFDASSRRADFDPTSLSFFLTDWSIIKAQAGTMVTRRVTI